MAYDPNAPIVIEEQHRPSPDLLEGTCEVHDDRLTVAVIHCAMGRVQLCGECYNHPDVKCPKCGHRDFGKYIADNGTIGCPVCMHEWPASNDE